MIVKSSSLPISINMERTNFEKFEKMLKFITGPTFEKPGPTFPRHVATELIHVTISKFSRDIMTVPIIKVAR